MQSNQPIRTRDASAIAAGGCLVSIPIVLYAGFKGMLSMAEKQEHAMSHQVEEVEIKGDAMTGTQIPAEETLGRLVASLRRTVTPFEKMGARFEPAAFESESTKLENVKKKFQAEGNPPSAEAQAMIREFEQTLARYAPQK